MKPPPMKPPPPALRQLRPLGHEVSLAPSHTARHTPSGSPIPPPPPMKPPPMKPPPPPPLEQLNAAPRLVLSPSVAHAAEQ
jgi:hypothetical protein